MPVFDAEAWVASMRGKLPDAELDTVAAEIRRGFMRQDEFNRKLNENQRIVDNELQKIREVEAEQKSWWAEVYEPNEVKLQRIAEIEQTYGDLDEFTQAAGGTMRDQEGNYISKEEYNQLAAELESLKQSLGRVERLEQALPIMQQGLQEQMTTAIKFTTKKAAKHARDFGEDFDVEEFDTFVGEQLAAGRHFENLDAAYDVWTAPKRAKLEERKQEEWKQQTRKELEADIESRRGITADPSANASSPFFITKHANDAAADKAAGRVNDRDSRQSFAAAFYGADET